jgi:BlaR1 peptidase M56
MLLWLLGVGASGVRYAQGWRDIRSLWTACEPVGIGWLNLTGGALCRRLGIRQPPRLLRMQDTGSPFLIGALRPAIVLPTTLLAECSAAALELMLAHELAHLKRRDLLWGWLPAAVHALFWFHPLVWLAGAEWCLAQEMACDELAVRVTNAPPGDYGALLLKVAAQSRARVAGGLITVGILESYHTLQRRLMAMKSIGQVSSRRIVLIGGMLAALGVGGLVPWRVTAQSSGTANDKASIDSANRESNARLKQLGTALLMYAQDYDEILPPMKTPMAVKKALYPYVRKNDAVFLDPHADEPYQANPSVSGKAVGVVTLLMRGPGRGLKILKYTRIRRRGEVVALYEPSPAPDGTRGVVFLDGHVTRIREAEWPRLKQASGMP